MEKRNGFGRLGIARLRSGPVCWVALAFAALASGCGVTRKIAVGSMVPILENTATAARERTDLGTIAAAYPANLLLLDGLIRTSPENAELLTLGAYLYFGYALGFVEEKEPKLASQYYAVGRDYGLRDLDRNKAFRNGRQGGFEAYKRGLRTLGKRDVPAMTWTGANWGRWLSLNLDSPAAIAQMPQLEALLLRAVELDPAYERGLPHALLGTYEVLRPKMFGGDPARAEEHFRAAFQLSGRRMLLYQVFYAEFYCRQVQDVQCFRKTLDEVQAAPGDLLPDSQLLNAIAKQRAERLRALENELF